MKKILMIFVGLAMMVLPLTARLPEEPENKRVKRPLTLNYTIPSLYSKEAVLEWVADNIKYESDMDVWGTGDYWQTPEETLTLMTGDCEDFTILAMALLYRINIYSALVLCDVANGMNGEEWEDEPDRDRAGHAMLWIWDGRQFSHSRGYYEPQTGRKAIYQYVLNGHISFNDTMYIAYNAKSLNPDKFRLPDHL